MSLINQMLRDLERRSQSTSVDKPTLTIKVPEPQQTGGRRQTVLIIVAILSVLFFAWQYRPWNTLPDTSALPATPPVAPLSSTNVQSSDAQQPSPAMEITAAPSTTNTETAGATNQTSEVLPSIEPTAQKGKAIDRMQAPIATPKPPKPKATAQYRPSNTKKTTAAGYRGSKRASADALYQQALDSSSQLMRKEHLYDALSQDPSHLPARTLLLQTLLKIGSDDEIERFLQQSLHHHPRHPAFVTAMAHLQVQRHDYRAALATLQTLDPGTINDPTYLALLAVSHQQLQEYATAATLYQRLTEIQPEKAEHWLGLGLCAEQLQQKQTALRAYREALAKNSLGGSVIDYIHQRLNALD